MTNPTSGAVERSDLSESCPVCRAGPYYLCGHYQDLCAPAPPADSQEAPVRQIEDCPELNMSNYGDVDVDRLNDWAIRADAEINRLSAARKQGGQHGAE